MKYAKPTKTLNTSLGFSLIELLITLSIIVITTSISIPSFISLINNNKVTTQTNAIFESLYLARSYAITRQKNVHVCHMSEPNIEKCDSNRDFNTSWSNGWLVFADINNDNEFDDNDNLIQVVSATSHINVIFNQRGRLRFFSDGSARSAGFYICDQQKINYRHIYLLYSGRARTSEQITTKQKKICDDA